MAQQRRPQPAADVAAIVLAAGRSSRMGDFKPLLPFGGRTLIGHVVASLRAAGVTRIHVVTGFNAEALAPEIDRLGVTRAHNADFDRRHALQRAGRRRLAAGGDGGVPAGAGRRAARARLDDRAAPRAAAARDAAVVYPTFRGERGHPPLVRRALVRRRSSAFDGDGRALRRCSRGARTRRATFRCSTGGASSRHGSPRGLSSTRWRRSCGAPAGCAGMRGDAGERGDARSRFAAMAAPSPPRRRDIARRLRAAGEAIEPDLRARRRLAARHRQRAAGITPKPAPRWSAHSAFRSLPTPIERHGDLPGRTTARRGRGRLSGRQARSGRDARLAGRPLRAGAHAFRQRSRGASRPPTAATPRRTRSSRRSRRASAASIRRARRRAKPAMEAAL